MSFFRRSDGGGFEAITARTVSMLADARHSFDLASTAVLSGADVRTVADDIRATDERINRTEQQLRGELVVHVSVQGSDDIGEVLGYTLLIKKIERIGDQAKNILDLAEEGIDLSRAPDSAELTRIRRTISDMMGEAADFLSGADMDEAAAFRERADMLRGELEAKIRDCMHSDLPGHEVVPRAILYRYWKRIVANVGGVVTTATEPLQHQGYFDDGTTDIDD
ncbi:MAG: PhoU domain-containing protein [Acidimicrobiales bacterium]